MIADTVDSLSRAYPGFVVRGSAGFVLQDGSVVQPGHCDYMKNRGGVFQEDSVTVFINVSARGRTFGVEGGGGLEEVHLGQGDVSVLSADAFHRGVVQKEASPTLFFYLDRRTDFRFNEATNKVGNLWADVEDKGGYSVGISFVSGLRGLTGGVKRGWKEKEGGGKRACLPRILV
jgi:hypothetical protein